MGETLLENKIHKKERKWSLGARGGEILEMSLELLSPAVL